MDDSQTPSEPGASTSRTPEPAAGSAAPGGRCYVCDRPVTNQNGLQKVCPVGTPPPPGQKRRCDLEHRSRQRARAAPDVETVPPEQVDCLTAAVAPVAAAQLDTADALRQWGSGAEQVYEALLRLDELTPREGLAVARRAAELIRDLNPVEARLARQLAKAQHDQEVAVLQSERDAVQRQLVEEQRRSTVLSLRLTQAERQNEADDVEGLARTAHALDDEVQRLQAELDLVPEQVEQAVLSAAEQARTECETAMERRWQAAESALRVEHEAAQRDAVRLAVDEAVERTRLEVTASASQDAARDAQAQLEAARQHDEAAHREELARLAATYEQHHEQVARLHAEELERQDRSHREALDRLQDTVRSLALVSQEPLLSLPGAVPLRAQRVVAEEQPRPGRRTGGRRSPAPRDPLPAEPDPAVPRE